MAIDFVDIAVPFARVPLEQVIGKGGPPLYHVEEAVKEMGFVSLARIQPVPSFEASSADPQHLECQTREVGKPVPGTGAIIAHARTKAALERFGGPGIDDVPLPTRLLDDVRTELTLGDRTLELAYIGHAHTNNLLVVRILPDRVIQACDFVRNQGVGYSNLPGVDMHELIAQLHRLFQLDYDHVAFCHTPPGDADSVRGYLRYVERLWDATAEAITDGLEADAAAERITSTTLAEYRDWNMAAEWFADNVRGMHRWLTEHPDVERPSGPTPVPNPIPSRRTPVADRPSGPSGG